MVKRVKQGGHHTPEDTIRRHYLAGIKNLITHYLPLVDSALILDNSEAESTKIIAKKDAKDDVIVEELHKFNFHVHFLMRIEIMEELNLL